MKKDIVAGLIVKSGKLLLVVNVKHNSLRMEPPGGKKNPDEGWKQAVIRELREELGIDVKVGKLFGVYSTNSPEGDFAVHMYFCDILSGEPQVTEPEIISNFAWYSFQDLLQEKNLVPNMKSALKNLRAFFRKPKGTSPKTSALRSQEGVQRMSRES